MCVCFRIHRPRATSVGLLTICVGCVAFFVPQFTTAVYRPTDELRVDSLCTVAKTSTCDRGRAGDSLSYYLPIFIISRFLVGMGTSPIISIGVTYIDDCSTKEKFATYAGEKFTCLLDDDNNNNKIIIIIPGQCLRTVLLS